MAIVSKLLVIVFAMFMMSSISRPLTYSGYDVLFHAAAVTIFPSDTSAWLWLKSQSYNESGFNPNARSNVGAQGLMQIMPGTNAGLGNGNVLDPTYAINAGARYDLICQHYFRAADSLNRWELGFAGYNAGPGNILKAQLLTKNQGGNPNNWNEVVLHQITRPSSIIQTTEYVERISTDFTKLGGK